MDFLNLGVLAHVDAGKTSLTERLLHTAGVIDEIGSVDSGTTQTDTLALERRRGITIKTAVASFVVDGCCVNLIDTPGHPDFIAEVERALSVLDGVILVISAVEGVQSQTRVLMRTLQRRHIPTVFFVNKIDRAGARPDVVLDAIARKLTPDIVPMGTISDLGHRQAAFIPAVDMSTALDVLTEHDDVLLRDYVDDEHTVSARRARRELARQSRRAAAHAVFFGSAVTGAGVPELMAALPTLLPHAGGDPAAPLAARVFKIDRSSVGEQRVWARVFEGTVRVRRPISPDGPKPTGVEVFAPDGPQLQEAAGPGRIVRLRGVPGLHVGDAVGEPPAVEAAAFAPPTLESVITPVDPRDRGRLSAALGELADQDPLIDVRTDAEAGELALSLYGEVQKEIVASQLAEDYGVAAVFRDTSVVCIERLTGTGAAVEFIGADSNPLLATVGLRVDPAPAGSGVGFALEVELGSMPPAFFRAVEESLRPGLRHGPSGWTVTDCVVTMTHSGYWARQSHAHGTFDKSMSSTAGDFRELTRIVLGRAVRRAGTVVCEPVQRVSLEFPVGDLGGVLGLLSRVDAVPGVPVLGDVDGRLDADVPAARLPHLAERLAGVTSGEGLLESRFSHYAPVRGTPPVRNGVGTEVGR